jgi:hypothetical protein
MSKSLIDIFLMGYLAVGISVLFAHYDASSQLERLSDLICDEQYKAIKEEVEKKGDLAMGLLTGGAVLLLIRNLLGI